jgi:riboflavin kinase / FMN adenylyltransferase
MNIGKRPTFEGDKETMEVNIFDFSSDIYGKEIQIQFVDRIRDEQAFDGVEALKGQLKKDENSAKEILKKISPNIAKQHK